MRAYLVRVACAVSLVVFSRIAFQILPPLLCLLATLGAACMGVALLCDLVARIIPWEVSAALLVLGAVFVLRAYKAFNSVQCLPSGPDDMAKALLLMAMFIASILTFSIIAMTFARMEAELR